MAEEALLEREDIAEEAPSAPAKSSALKNQTTIIAIVVGVIVVGAALGFFFLKPKYNTLYTNLNQSDAAAIGSYLQKNNIPFKIGGNGDAIGVANTSVPKLRLELASKGLPRGGSVGFEIFDKTNLTVTDFSQKLNYRRALEGELARTIGSLESVKSAKVHLALAQKNLFKNSEEKSTASVVIVADGGMELNQEQIKGIRYLVASAIQGLEPQDVQITDMSGNSLVDFNDESTQQQQKLAYNEKLVKDYENKLESNLMKLLSPILGTGNVLVNVTAEMNFDESEIDIELYAPVDDKGNAHEPVIRSEKISTEKYKKGQGPSGAVPGAQTNLPSFAGKNKSTTKDGRDYVKEDKTRNYEISRTIEKVKKAVGLIEKVSVAVVVNKDITPSERATLRRTIAVAAGLDLERGDQIAINGIRFSSTPHLSNDNVKLKKENKRLETLATLKKTVALVIAGFLAIIIIGILLNAMKAPLDAAKSKQIEDLLDQEDVPLLNSINEKLKEAEEAFQRKLDDNTKPTLIQMKKDLAIIAEEDPAGVAKGLRAFIDD